MKVEKKESSPCVLALSVTAGADEIKEEYQKVLTAFIKNAVVPGFRKGKIPLPVLKQKFQAEIAQESQQACFSKLYPEALKEASGAAAVKDGAVAETLPPLSLTVFRVR